MMFDLTTKISAAQMEQWLEKNERRHVAAGHIGTHLDTYQKTTIPLEYCKSGGICADVSGIGASREIDVCDVAHIDLRRGDFILFHTAWIERFPYGSAAYFRDHPQLSHALIDHLIERKVHFIGIDCPGIRQGDEHSAADVRCEDNGIYVIENLCNLKQLSKNRCTVYTMWLDDPTMTGLKCRVIAEINESSISGESASKAPQHNTK